MTHSEISDFSFFIPGNTPSSKNNRVWTGVYFVPSERTKKWRRDTELFWGNKKRKVFSTWELQILGDNQQGYFGQYIELSRSYEWGGGNRMLFQYLTSMLPLPLHIELTFIRNSKHRFDYINLAQGVFDEMVEHDWIPDDSADHVIPYFGRYLYDKNNPGTIIKILKNN